MRWGLRSKVFAPCRPSNHGNCQKQSYTWPVLRNLHLQVLHAKNPVQDHVAVVPEQALLDEAVRA